MLINSCLIPFEHVSVLTVVRSTKCHYICSMLACSFKLYWVPFSKWNKNTGHIMTMMNCLTAKLTTNRHVIINIIVFFKGIHFSLQMITAHIAPLHIIMYPTDKTKGNFVVFFLLLWNIHRYCNVNCIKWST